jgi:uncharacterized protein with HEPN domain
MTDATRIPDYLGHILQVIERIERHTADVDEMAFLSSELIQDAVIRILEIIGEAAATCCAKTRALRRNMQKFHGKSCTPCATASRMPMTK